MLELSWAYGGVGRNFCGLRGGYAGTFVGGGGVCRNFWGLRGGVCRNFWGLRGGYAGTFVGLGRGMPEPSWAQGGDMP